MRHWQPHPRLKKAGKFILISAITYGPTRFKRLGG